MMNSTMTQRGTPIPIKSGNIMSTRYQYTSPEENTTYYFTVCSTGRVGVFAGNLVIKFFEDSDYKKQIFIPEGFQVCEFHNMHKLPIPPFGGEFYINLPYCVLVYKGNDIMKLRQERNYLISFVEGCEENTRE